MQYVGHRYIKGNFAAGEVEERQKERTQKEAKDSRNLYLAREGIIREGTKVSTPAIKQCSLKFVMLLTEGMYSELLLGRLGSDLLQFLPNQQGESRAILPTLQDWFRIREQRLRHC